MNEQVNLRDLQELLDTFRSEAIELQPGDDQNIILTGKIKLLTLLDIYKRFNSVKLRGRFVPMGIGGYKVEIEQVRLLEGNYVYVTHKMGFGKDFSDYSEREVEFTIQRQYPTSVPEP